MNLRMVIVSLAASTLFGCAAQQQQASRGEENASLSQHRVVSDRPSTVAPGRCRIVGTLVAVDSTLEQSGPCSKAPCRGTVRVDSVLGYGSAFGNPLAPGNAISVHFAFTLSFTSEELFPTMTQRLPGLAVGSKFQADVESRLTPAPGQEGGSYVIQGYQKLN